MFLFLNAYWWRNEMKWYKFLFMMHAIVMY
jgi:hypothetical protein